MSAPGNEFAFDFDVMTQAAKNWRERAVGRDRNATRLKERQYDAVEPRERLAKRVNRLLGKVRDLLPQREVILPDALRTLVLHPTFAPEEIDNVLVERVIGETRDFLSMEFFEKALLVGRRVGRIVTPLGGGRKAFGTGFLVSPQLLLTNHHVLPTEDRAAGSIVEFNYQLDCNGQPLPVCRYALQPARFFLNDKPLDFALVALAPVSQQGKPLSDFGYCPLIQEEGKVHIGEPINIIQHPLGEMKQVVVRENKLLDLLEKMAHYEADTEPGSSGSPVFNDQWEVVALHHSGVPKMDAAGTYLDRDGNVWKEGDDPTRLAWVANEGIRISRLMAFITTAPLKPEMVPLRDELLKATPPPPPPVHVPEIKRPVTPEVTRQPTGQPRTGAVSLSIPLDITVSLGTPEVAEPRLAATEPEADATALEAIQPDTDYDSRPGYDKDFLGFPVPLPTLTEPLVPHAFALPGVSGADKFELKYHHYSVLFNRDRRLAFLAAVNFDAAAPFKHKREGKDKWFPDPRVDEEFQAGAKYYDGNPLDKGHLVMRADAGWGATKEEAKLANDDTFHLTNCSPQHEVFNQASKATQAGVRLWGSIEGHIAAQARKDKRKLCILNGPVFRANDRKYKDLQVPREFWKLVVFENDAGRPRAVAFKLSQASLIKSLPSEEFVVDPYRPFQVKVRDLEAATKLDFGPLRQYDPLEDPAHEGFLEAGVEAVPLETLDDIAL
ncbi:MAG TPA: DNA/RNA non-specific endonuclease [Planctomycetota bacterium]|nr:DNA/RNA non-specific endonuclease [Planctomycetota bacterium]